MANSTLNGTAPHPEKLGWTTTPNNRGSIDIIYSCVVILFLCSWNVLHLNIPSTMESRRAIFLRKLKWMLIALWLPEFVTGVAFNQWRLARKLRSQLKTKSWTQAWFCVAGGLRHALPYSPAPDDTGPQPPAWEPRVLQFCTEDGAVALHPQVLESIALPDPERIMAENKADSLAKLIIVFQITWFIAQCISRAAEKLPMSQLEIGTVAFVGCTLLTTFFWWHKPLDIRLCMLLSSDELSFAHSLEPKTKHSSTRIFLCYERLPNFVYYSEALMEYQQIKSGPQKGEFEWVDFDGSNLISWDNNAVIDIGISGILAILFGSIHLTAWNFEFPSNQDQISWRVGSLCVTLLPIVWAILVYTILTVEIKGPIQWLKNTSDSAKSPTWLCRAIGNAGVQKLYDILRLEKMVEWWGDKTKRREALQQLGPQAFVVFYMAARLLLAMLMFKSFISMPAGVYDTVQWVDNILHI